MPKSKVTSKKAASEASETLRNKKTGPKSKTAAGSALSQTKAPKKSTSEKAATAASQVLKDKRTSGSSKTAAGSALSQKRSDVKSPPKSGSVKKSAVARAVALVSAKRSTKK